MSGNVILEILSVKKITTKLGMRYIVAIENANAKRITALRTQQGVPYLLPVAFL